MKYTVAWNPIAEKKLATIWNDASDRTAITAASNEIDFQLGKRPSSVGESRFGDGRILTVSPLSVYFDVSEDDCTVIVWAVWVSDR